MAVRPTTPHRDAVGKSTLLSPQSLASWETGRPDTVRGPTTVVSKCRFVCLRGSGAGQRAGSTVDARRARPLVIMWLSKPMLAREGRARSDIIADPCP